MFRGQGTRRENVRRRTKRERKRKERKAHFGSAASNSRITRSVLSGKWCSEQKAKYDESIFLVAPLVSSEAG